MYVYDTENARNLLIINKIVKDDGNNRINNSVLNKISGKCYFQTHKTHKTQIYNIFYQLNLSLFLLTL